MGLGDGVCVGDISIVSSEVDIAVAIVSVGAREQAKREAGINKNPKISRYAKVIFIIILQCPTIWLLPLYRFSDEIYLRLSYQYPRNLAPALVIRFLGRK